MPAIDNPLPVLASRTIPPETTPFLLLRRDTGNYDHGNYAKPGNMNPGVLVVFSLIAASLGLLAWWLFIRRSGFIWRASDWQDYKASVLRRPDERPDDAITVFSDGTARRGGGSSVGARTVVLGELDTTYTKSYVSTEKSWGPREAPRAARDGGRQHGILGNVWGKLRGGEPSDNGTALQRGVDLGTRRKSRREHRSQRRPGPRDDSNGEGSSFVPPLARAETRTRREASVRRPTRAPTRSKKGAPVTKDREPSYAIGDDRDTRYHRQGREAESSSSSEETSSSEEETDSDDDSIDQSQLGMAKGNKVYHHPISQERVFWGNARPMEKNSGAAGGTFGGGAPAVMPVASRGYRAGSAGSLSSIGSVGSSNAGAGTR